MSRPWPISDAEQEPPSIRTQPTRTTEPGRRPDRGASTLPQGPISHRSRVRAGSTCTRQRPDAHVGTSGPVNASDRYALLSAWRPPVIWGWSQAAHDPHPLPAVSRRSKTGTQGEEAARRSLVPVFSTSHSGRPHPPPIRPPKRDKQPAVAPAETSLAITGGICSAPGGARTPSRAERVAIWCVHGPGCTGAPSHRRLVRLDPDQARKGCHWALEGSAPSPRPRRRRARWSWWAGCGWTGAAGQDL
ncbi:hypothetical protein EDD91_5199 [Streptomyces sp. KS 21]|nr:hypothetical protein EDD91_5199 [Streptomyces sp. KS 21]